MAGGHSAPASTAPSAGSTTLGGLHATAQSGGTATRASMHGMGKMFLQGFLAVLVACVVLGFGYGLLSFPTGGGGGFTWPWQSTRTITTPTCAQGYHATPDGGCERHYTIGTKTTWVKVWSNFCLYKGENGDRVEAITLHEGMNKVPYKSTTGKNERVSFILYPTLHPLCIEGRKNSSS